MAALRRDHGVTLIELSVVLLIIAGLISLLFPAINGVRESARAASCRNNLHQLRLAMQQFLDTNQGSPHGNEWPVQLLPYHRSFDDSAFSVDVRAVTFAR
jgi:prepilin-type N-terminal cleavage/methylation domain-containing protein